MASAADRVNTRGLPGTTWADLSSGFGRDHQHQQPGEAREITSGGGGGSDDGLEEYSDAPEDVVTPASATTAPPYWSASKRLHQRTSSNVSAESLPAGAITLRDNEDAEDDDRNNACWAKSVEIVDHTVINSNATNIGAFVVWIIRVETLNGSYMNIRKRYSEFDEFRDRLVQSFPNFEAMIPTLPPKSVISKFRPRFLEKRRAGLQYFLNCILLNPEFSGSPVLKDFLFQ